ncbi:hypothetical protein DJ568_12475 [Mucilaginibacter hurinus]|uniref:BIG2 domain-containing protein n=1 Tax=Mucilaginibacter hurinus TaxID=2201324 RepID=A0A367GNL1_9SPHI|nr:LamG-like jellyroll fold domain-containing protein [Mucilaginibacter hurinus]RCH54628.1 hypothetical protein DJ568_12475 [Mucilaginibacter hurinus]
MMRNLLKAVFMLLAGALIFTSCSKVYQDDIHRNILQAIKIDSSTLHMFTGEKLQVPVTTTPATYSLDSLNWLSSDTAVLSISTTGLLTAKTAGTSTITISNLDSTLSATVFVTVTDEITDSLNAGLIAYYPFNNSAADSSGNNYNGIAIDVLPTTNRNNLPNTAYQFNGSSSHIIIEDAEPLRLSNTNFTVSMWVKIDSYIAASGSALLSKNKGSNQQGWNCSIVGTDNYDGAFPGNLFYNVSGGTDPFAAGIQTIDTVDWHMISVTYDLAVKEVSLYIDGMLDTRVREIPTPNPSTNAKLHIGNNSLLDIDSFANSYFFNGKLDDIRIYNRKLSGAEIAKLLTIPD